MNQSRKLQRRMRFKPAAHGMPLPAEWTTVQTAERDRASEAMTALQKMLPDRGIILLTIPSGTSSQNVEAMACVNNLADRSQVASVFEAMLEWWSPQIITAQPDRAAVAALREGVDAVNDIPIAEVARQLGATTMRVLEAIAARRLANTDDCLILATIALSLFGKTHQPVQHEAPGGSADGSGAPAPEPLPPRREWPKGNTKETLVADILERPQSEDRDQIIAMAREGKFHDYEAEVPTPKALLIDILSRFGYPDLAGKARDGGYNDEHQTLEQAEELRRDIGPDVHDAFLGVDPSKRGKA
jgi:hypothetical protein